MLLNNFSELFWHASQAIEKYLKAGLLLNGRVVASGSHEVGKLYEQHCEVFGDLAVADFARPEKLDPEIWWDGTVKEFLEKISTTGSPDSRYGLSSWWREPDDLFKIDQLCFGLRRVAVGLDWIVNDGFPAVPSLNDFEGQSYAVALRSNPDLSAIPPLKHLERPLAEIGNTRADLLQEALKNLGIGT